MRRHHSPGWMRRQKEATLASRMRNEGVRVPFVGRWEHLAPFRVRVGPGAPSGWLKLLACDFLRATLHSAKTRRPSSGGPSAGRPRTDEPAPDGQDLSISCVMRSASCSTDSPDPPGFPIGLARPASRARFLPRSSVLFRFRRLSAWPQRWRNAYCGDGRGCAILGGWSARRVAVAAHPEVSRHAFA